VAHGGSLKPESIATRPNNGCLDSSVKECVYKSGCQPIDVNECKASISSSKNMITFAEELADYIKLKAGGHINFFIHYILFPIILFCEIFKRQCVAFLQTVKNRYYVLPVDKFMGCRALHF